MYGVYVAEYQATSVNSARTLMYLTAPSTACLEIYAVTVTETNVTATEQLDFQFASITSLGTPTATAVTPIPTENGSPASTATCKANVTASEPTYAAVAYDRQGIPNSGGYYMDAASLPESRVVVSPSASVGVKLMNAPANTYTFNVQITYRQIGG